MKHLFKISTFVSVCYGEDGRCRGHETGPGFRGNGKSKRDNFVCC